MAPARHTTVEAPPVRTRRSRERLVSRLGSGGKRAPSLATLKRYASAVGCELQVKLVPHKAALSR
jgi:hypothetical protein